MSLTILCSTALAQPAEESPEEQTPVATEEMIDDEELWRTYDPLPPKDEQQAGRKRLLKDWEFSFSPEFWLSAMDGDVTVTNVKSSPDHEIQDLMEELEGTLGYTLEAKWGSLIIRHEASTFEFEDDNARLKAVNRTIPGITDPDTIGKATTVTGEKTTVSIAVGVRAVDRLSEEQYEEISNRHALDLFLGFRLHETSTKVRLRFTELGEPASKTVSQDEQWSHGFVGARYIHTITNKADLILYGDVAGFDRADDWAMNLSLFYNIHVTQQIDVYVGYRHNELYHDDDGSFEYELSFSGPLIGLTVHF